ncbi:MAG: type I restriction-modification system subunit M N-terminal domain-containing protein [Dissulfurispiraceae bacterium]|nr:type I restriction-modification system subunit M N-terminal domain-containing protein [Dissulfurispiraceae bacterium]
MAEISIEMRGSKIIRRPKLNKQIKRKNMAKTKENKNIEPIEKQLWKSTDKLRKNIDAAEYKHVVLGLIFLKYISDAFEDLHAKLKSCKGEYAGADPEDKDEYKAENVFFVPEIARWSYLQSKTKLPTIGKEVDNAMDAIEKDNPSLKDVLPKVFARGNLDPTSLGGLIDLIGNIALGDAKARSADVLGHVFEYFLGEFALAEGKKGGQFYTPRSAENFKGEGVPVIRGTNLNYFRYVDGDFVFLNEKKADELKSSNCYPGDLVFTHRGTIGQVGLIPSGKYPRYIVSQSGMKVTPNAMLLDNMFLFYFFKSKIGQHELLQHESQVGVPSISRPLTSLKSVNLLLPLSQNNMPLHLCFQASTTK